MYAHREISYPMHIQSQLNQFTFTQSTAGGGLKGNEHLYPYGNIPNHNSTCCNYMSRVHILKFAHDHQTSEGIMAQVSIMKAKENKASTVCKH